MFKLDSKIKAFIITIVFSVVGIFSCIYFISDWKYSLPLVIFYIVLLINTHFSINLFSKITPPDIFNQYIVDILLFFIYLGLVINFNNSFYFVSLTTVLFAIATLKYSLLLGVVSQPKLLKRKIIIDLSGVLGGILILGGIIAGYDFISSWIFTISFIIANLLLYFVWPLYRLDI